MLHTRAERGRTAPGHRSAGRGAGPPSRILLAVWALLALAGAGAGSRPVWAEEPTTPPGRLEVWHSWVESALTWTGVGIDSFFDAHSQDGMELPTEESYGRIRLYPHYDDSEFSLGTHASATLGLPNLERWFKVRFTTEPVDVLPGTDPSTVEPVPQLGADVPLIRRSRFSLKADVSVGWSGGVDPYTGLRAKLELPWRRWTTRVDARQFWRYSDGFGHFTRLYFDRPIGEKRFLRFISAYEWTQFGDQAESSQTVRLGWILRPERRYLLFAASLFAEDWRVDSYRAEVTLRYRTRYPWCFVEFTPGGDFPREHGFSYQPRARIGLDIFFGGRPLL